jgi:hypothetical protein
MEKFRGRAEAGIGSLTTPRWIILTAPPAGFDVVLYGQCCVITELGPCEILARIGAGGVGEIYRARDQSGSLNHRIAADYRFLPTCT